MVSGVASVSGTIEAIGPTALKLDLSLSLDLGVFNFENDPSPDTSAFKKFAGKQFLQAFGNLRNTHVTQADGTQVKVPTQLNSVGFDVLPFSSRILRIQAEISLRDQVR